MSAILTWILLALIPVAAVVIRLWAGEDPRADEETGDGPGDDVRAEAAAA